MKSLGIDQTKWDLTPLFTSDNDPTAKEKRKEVQEKSYEFINKWKDRDDYLKDPAVLKEALDEYEVWNRLYGCYGVEEYYFWLRSTQDGNDPDLKAKINKTEDFGRKILNDIQFFNLNISKISQDKQKKFLESEDLKEYKHFLERNFAWSPYLLSEPEEKILTLKSDTSHMNWVRMVSDFLAKEEREVLLEDGKRGNKNFSEILSLSLDRNKKVRDVAAKALNEIQEKHLDVAEVEINSILANKKTNDELRNMSRPDLSRHIGDDVASEVVDSLINSVSSRFNITREYYELKAKLMGVEKLEYHECNVPYGKLDKTYSYEEAVNLVYSVFAKLDTKFSDIFAGFVKNNQIDVYPRKGKRDGAFCAYNLISQPTYLFLNYTNKIDGVLTLAHELGHGINYELIKEKQNAVNFGTFTSTAEVASTFMEDFVLEELLKDADDELKLAIMMNKLNEDTSAIFRQVACYKFEQELHGNFREKGYLSKKDIGELFRKHMLAYMGDFVEQSPGSQNWWVRWGHIRAFFYVYSYASGFLISKSLQNSVKKDPQFINEVKEFLLTGLAESPKDVFAKLGVDITDKGFWDKGLDETEKLLEETKILAKKLGKI